MTDAYLKASIEPKSDQLNADDLLAGPMTVTVRKVKQGPSKEQPVEIVVDGHRPYRPCKSMRRVLIACWGDKGAEWAGRSMTLYADPSVKFGGVAVGGIRVSHLSHIEHDASMMLTTTRSRRAEYRVQRLDHAPAEYPAADFAANVDRWADAINEGKLTVPDVIRRASDKGALTSEQVSDLESRVNSD